MDDLNDFMDSADLPETDYLAAMADLRNRADGLDSPANGSVIDPELDDQEQPENTPNFFDSPRPASRRLSSEDSDDEFPENAPQTVPELARFVHGLFHGLRREVREAVRHEIDTARSDSRALVLSDTAKSEIPLYCQAILFCPDVTCYKGDHIESTILKIMRFNKVKGVPAESETSKVKVWRDYIQNRLNSMRCKNLEIIRDSIAPGADNSNIGDLALALCPKYTGMVFDITQKHLERLALLRSMCRADIASKDYAKKKYWDKVEAWVEQYHASDAEERFKARSKTIAWEVQRSGHPTKSALGRPASSVSAAWQSTFETQVAKMGLDTHHVKCKKRKRAADEAAAKAASKATRPPPPSGSGSASGSGSQ